MITDEEERAAGGYFVDVDEDGIEECVIGVSYRANY